MKICLDPGHGGWDSGCVSPAGVREADVNLAFCLEAQPLLERLGHTILLSRGADKAFSPHPRLDLQARCDAANRWNADIFVSIHCNAPGRPQDAEKARGIEAYALSAAPLATRIVWFMAAFTDSVLRGAFTHRRFYVLRNTRMPAVLVEIGFLSHPGEGVLLTQPSYRARLIDGLAAGIETWRREVS